ncbi:aminotransferase class V-fold PLP-dependent enzyme [Allomuricauda sp. SCSIO 65647]|uniref:aminotransferase class V-fold PLP-dependent enzyme n=1 Tax=Allomuricauda sp. SCSIO 65647 TaxID=2908843 RepID=UPI001F4421C8|nr:aminotransferase class V-fold PLP-dependent enzyme [Muricauda sp. SCSIO 65647]UJH68283.1 aminotransferase class V-fold PLP-dependent enzyme [Muricauda sp. SCSIO 65647]
MTIDQIRKQFPAVQHGIYANTAAAGPLYDSLFEWRQEHELDLLMKASGLFVEGLKIISETRKSLGSFFCCPTENIALTPNFTIGLNMLLDSFPKKAKVLLLSNDYPSLNWPFEFRDFDIEYLAMVDDLESQIYEAVKNRHIDILALSLVQWLNGILIDLDFLKDLKNEFKDLIIVADGTQFCGMFPFDFSASGIDILGASGYKWLLSGYGNGFMLFKEKSKERFMPKSVGFGSVEGDFDKKDNFRFCKHFEPGHLNSLTFGSLNFSLSFLEAVGLQKIGNHNKALSETGKQLFGDMGLLEEAVVKRIAHSTIFNIKGDKTLLEHLRQNDIVCAQRGDGIRLSFHFYNTLQELEELAKIVNGC